LFYNKENNQGGITMKIVAELEIVPVGVGPSISNYIAECERVLNKKNLTIQLHAAGTNIEGEMKDVFEAIQECIEAVHQLGAPRIVTDIKVISRTDKPQTMQKMVESVENKI
jgi:uncharacterized protein (TIGR00106 family)